MMTRISAVVVVLCALASTLGAADTPEADVLKVVLSNVPRGCSVRTLPAVLSDHTSGGAERFAGEWIKKRRGDVIGSEIAAAFVEQNRTSVPVAAPANLILADLRPFENSASYDWEKLDLQFPRGRPVVVVSRPAFDRSGSIALVRFDLIGREDDYTTFVDVERQPDGTWKITMMATGSYESMHRSDITLSPGR
jgi:hypothetical protein